MTDDSREAQVAETGGLGPTAPVDVSVLREEIEKTYSDVTTKPEICAGSPNPRAARPSATTAPSAKNTRKKDAVMTSPTTAATVATTQKMISKPPKMPPS